MRSSNRILFPVLLGFLALAGCAREDEPATQAPAAPEIPESETVQPPPPPEAPVRPTPPPEAPAQAPEPAVAANPPEISDPEYAQAVDAFRTSAAVQPFFESAYGYAIFPTIGKGGFVVGGAYGKGRVYVDGEHMGDASMTQLSAGLQAGGQAFSQMIFFEDEEAYKNFTGGNFEFAAEAEAVAITASIGAQATSTGNSAGGSGGKNVGTQADTRYKNGMATFVYAKGGVMAGAAIGGQKFSFEAI